MTTVDMISSVACRQRNLSLLYFNVFLLCGLATTCGRKQSDLPYYCETSICEAEESVTFTALMKGTVIR